MGVSLYLTPISWKKRNKKPPLTRVKLRGHEDFFLDRNGCMVDLLEALFLPARASPPLVRVISISFRFVTVGNSNRLKAFPIQHAIRLNYCCQQQPTTSNQKQAAKRGGRGRSVWPVPGFEPRTPGPKSSGPDIAGPRMASRHASMIRKCKQTRRDGREWVGGTKRST